MTQLEKMIAKIGARPPQADFAEVRALLEALGWVLDRERGSHVVFKKAGEYPIIFPKQGGRKVKREYLAHICERLGLDE